MPLDTDLVETATQPAPDESTVPDSNPGDGGPGASGKVAISGYSQGNHPWCVPAATATTLSAFGVTSDVAYLASEEGTTAAGTPIGNAVPSLRKREKRNYYIYDHQSSASDLMSKVATDIWNFQAPVIVGVDTRDLSWWSNSSSQGAHVLTVYLYYTSNGGGFRVQDSGAGGKYSISLANLTAANNARGSELDW